MTDVTTAVHRLLEALGDSADEQVRAAQALFAATCKDKELKAALRPIADCIKAEPLAPRLLQCCLESSPQLFRAAATWVAAGKLREPLLVPQSALTAVGPQPSRCVSVLAASRDGTKVWAAESDQPRVSVWSAATGAHEEDQRLPGKEPLKWLLELDDGTLRGLTPRGELLEQRPGAAWQSVGRVADSSKSFCELAGSRWLVALGTVTGAQGPRDSVHLWDLDQRKQAWQWVDPGPGEEALRQARVFEAGAAVLSWGTRDEGAGPAPLLRLLSLRDGAPLGDVALPPGHTVCDAVVWSERAWIQTSSETPAGTSFAWHRLNAGQRQLVPEAPPPGAGLAWFADGQRYVADLAICDAAGKVLASYKPLEDFNLVATAVDAKNDRLLLAGSNQPFPVKMLVPFTGPRAAAALEAASAPPAAKAPKGKPARAAKPKKAR